MSRPIRCLFASAALLVGCTATIEPPGAAIEAYVSAIEGGDCARAYRQLDESVRAGRSVSEFREHCEQHHELYRAQAREISRALHRDQVAVYAEVPLDRLRGVTLEHVDGEWFVAGGVDLIDGAPTPVASMQSLAAALESDGVVQLLSLLSDDMRARYAAEIDALVGAVAASASSELAVYGDSASVAFGEITIRLVRENGAWRVSSVEQPYVYDDYYLEEW